MTRIKALQHQLLRKSSAALLVAAGGVVFTTHDVHTAPGTQGQWTTLPYQVPTNLNPIHAALMNNGKILLVSGSGNDPSNQSFDLGVWDPQGGTITVQPVAWDMFCNDMSVLPDGRVLINGGTLRYDNPFEGLSRSSIYDPGTNTVTDIGNMAHGRWYPTLTTLTDGRVMTFSGADETGATNTAVEIYTPGGSWSPEYQAGWTPPAYPRLHLLPSGTVFYSGPSQGSRLFNPATNSWSDIIANQNYSGIRTYGSSVLLPLSPKDGYRPRVMIFGGGNPATATTEIIDLSAANPSWQYGPSMSQSRIEMNATILPNKKVLVLGGSANDEDASTASLNADLFDPTVSPTTVTSAGTNVYPRLYHSNSLLLPDARVLFFGGNPLRGTVERHIEVYSPSYLFNANGTAAVRPTITAVTPNPMSYGGAFQIQTPDSASIASVVLMRPGTPTHAFDNEQRLVDLSYTAGNGVLNVTAPPNGSIAPPGYYLLFALNSAGVPSVGVFVQLLFQVATPSFAPPGGNYESALSVTISDTTPGAQIYFTTDGSTPTTSSTVYSGPVAVSASTTLKAIGVLTGSIPSAVATARYAIGSARDDFDGDGLADIAVFRKSTGQWFVLNSAGGSTTQGWGAPSLGDIAVPADYDGDGKTDIAVYRSSTGQWFILKSSGGSIIEGWGSPALGDIPVPGDYDGDGKADLAVYRSSTGQWFILNSSGGATTQGWGSPALGDIPVPADYDGDGKTDIAVYRNSTGQWFVLNSSGGATTQEWGSPALGDIPVPADYDGDGKADIAVYRNSTGQWFILNSSGGSTTQGWGSPSLGDIPVPGDYDNDGKADIAVYRGSTGTWYILKSSGGSTIMGWGSPALGDTPIELPQALR